MQRPRHISALPRRALLGVLALLCLPTNAQAAPHRDKKLSYAVGTGFYVTHEGHIITANHVIANCSGPISVHGRLVVIKAKVISTDPEHDLALLKIIPNFTIPYISQFRPLSRALKVNEPVIVTGYPSESMNGEFVEFLTGDAKITYTKSHIGDDSQFMFTYAAKSGYSGGPVLDASGNVIGMTASATCTSANCMDGFKRTFSMKASTIEEVEQLEETIAKHVDTNIATSLPIIYRFLDKNKITYEMSDAVGAPDSERINQIAQSVANIRCPSEEKSLVESAGVVRTEPKK